MKSESIFYVCSSLRVSLQLIDRAIARIDAKKLFPEEQHRTRLACAMVEILEVVESLRSSTPELSHASAEARKLSSSYDDLFKVAVLEAQTFEAERNFGKAATRYSQFLETCGSHTYQVLARGELQRLQSLGDL